MATNRTRERVTAVGSRRGDDHGEVADAQLTDAVDRRHTAYVVVGSDAAAHVLEAGQGRRVGRVVQGRHPLAAVVVADLADEEREAAGTVVAQGVEDLGHVERGVADVDEAKEVGHGAECRTTAALRGAAQGWARWVTWEA